MQALAVATFHFSKNYYRIQGNNSQLVMSICLGFSCVSVYNAYTILFNYVMSSNMKRYILLDIHYIFAPWRYSNGHCVIQNVPFAKKESFIKKWRQV